MIMIKDVSFKNKKEYHHREKVERNESLVQDYLRGMGPVQLVKKYWDQGVRTVSRVYQILELYRPKKD